MAIKLEEKTLIKFIGTTLEDYVNAQILACTELKIPVFDAYHSNIIDSYNPAFRNKCMVTSE